MAVGIRSARSAAGARLVACGGGIVLQPAARELLRRRCRTVWLEVSPREAARRVRQSGGTRPLLGQGDPEPRLVALAAERAPLYAEVADLRVTTDGRSPDEVAAAVARALDPGAA